MKINNLKNILFLSSIMMLVNAQDKSSSDNQSGENMTPKIAYVNIDKIITLNPNALSEAADEWRDLFNGIQDKMEPLNKDISDLEERFEKGRTDFETLQKSGLSSKESLQKKYEEVGRIEMELRKKFQDREQTGQRELQKAQSKFGPKLERIIEDTRKSGGWDLILRGEIVLSGNKNFDLTTDVTKKLNKSYADSKKEAAKAKAPAAKPAKK